MGQSSVDRNFRDMKLPTQVMLEKQTFSAPAAAGTDEVLDDSAGNTSAAAATVTTFVAQPDVARNLVITPGSTTADVADCTVVVSGTDYLDEVISEEFVIPEFMSTAVTGGRAFKSVTSVLFPAGCENTPFEATWDIGYGEKLGLKRCMDEVGHAVFSTVDGAYEATRATIAANASIVSANTADFNGTMDGSDDFELFFIQNFAQSCMP